MMMVVSSSPCVSNRFDTRSSGKSDEIDGPPARRPPSDSKASLTVGTLNGPEVRTVRMLPGFAPSPRGRLLPVRGVPDREPGNGNTGSSSIDQPAAIPPSGGMNPSDVRSDEAECASCAGLRPVTASKKHSTPRLPYGLSGSLSAERNGPKGKIVAVRSGPIDGPAALGERCRASLAAESFELDSAAPTGGSSEDAELFSSAARIAARRRLKGTMFEPSAAARRMLLISNTWADLGRAEDPFPPHSAPVSGRGGSVAASAEQGA